MESLHISEHNVIKAQQRRASAEITQGIEPEIDACHHLDPLKRALECLLFFSIYGLGVVFVLWFEGPARILGVLLMGLAMNALGIFLHEGLHGLLAKKESINHMLSFLVGAPLFLSASAYQFTHNNHHYDLGRKLDYGTYSQHFQNPLLVWTAYLLQLFLGSFIYVLVIPVLSFVQAPNRVRRVIAVEYLLMTALFAVFFYFAPLQVILLYWVYPLLVVNVLSNIRGLASHALGDPEDIYLSSRSVLCPKWVSILFLHENYHLEHHLFPRVPSYHLERMHDLIWPRLPLTLTARSYCDFLCMFFRASLHRDLEPQGVRTPPHSSNPT
jgi:fatty acid desaturase